jgi:4-hydroxybenzoate polyprenyltransferase
VTTALLALVAGPAPRPSVRDHLELVRAPAVLTVLGDTLAGGAAAGHPASGRRVLLPLASACLYAGGMALNDWADRDLDAVERPERPIPSGRVAPGYALGVAAGLGAAGLALAAAGGGPRALAVAVPLAGCVWLYDARLKATAAGPVAMAACRGLDVLLGAGAGRLRAAAPAAAALAVHTAGVTALSRGEVHGTTSGVARAVAAGSVAVAAGALAGLRPTDRVATARVATVLATGAYLATCLPEQLSAAATPDGPAARAATGAGIRAMVPVQAAWAARAGRPGAAAVLGVVGLAGALLRRRAGSRAVSET